MSDERVYDLDGARADGWFDRVVAGVPALQRLCESVGEPLVALALAAGFRIVSAAVDRATGEVTALNWVRDDSGDPDTPTSGPPAALRTEVLASLLSEPDAPADPGDAPSAEALRAAIGARYVLLAPLFGLALRRLMVAEGQDARVAVFHDGVEEVVPVKQLRRFLRTRVVEVLQSDRSRGVAIDLAHAQEARAAFAAERYDEVVGRLAGWVQPLMMYHRTPDGQALPPDTRAEIARALATLGEAYAKLGRADDSDEALRLAVQYGQENRAGAEMYRTLARVMIAGGRHAEAIAPLRRALALDEGGADVLVDLASCYLAAGRAVAAYGCLREARARAVDVAAIAAVEPAVRAALGEEDLARYEALVTPPATDRPPPA